MANIIEFLEARIAEDEDVEASKFRYSNEKVTAAFGECSVETHGDGRVVVRPWDGTIPFSVDPAEFRALYTDPAPDKRMLAECEAKRAIVGQVSGWDHEYNDGDPWYSCGLAAGTFDDEPGSGCADESKHGRCTCDLVNRQRKLLSPLAAVYKDHSDYQQEWEA